MKCEYTFQDTTCPEFDTDGLLTCTKEATLQAVLSMPDPEGWDTFETYSCAEHATPLIPDAYMRVIRSWEQINGVLAGTAGTWIPGTDKYKSKDEWVPLKDRPS